MEINTTNVMGLIKLYTNLLSINMNGAIIDIVGKEKIQILIEQNDFYGLIKELEKYATEEEVWQFSDNIEFLVKNKYTYDKEIDEFKERTRDAYYFLLKTYTYKLIDELFTLRKRNLNLDMFKQKIALFIGLYFDNYVYIKNKRYEIYNEDELLRDFKEILINSRLSEYKKKGKIKIYEY